MQQSLVILSGGMDSTTLAYLRASEGRLAGLLSFDYGQRHKRELMRASVIAETLRVAWQRIDLSSVGPLLVGSSQTDRTVDVPEGHYAEESMKMTVVPNRNMMMLSVAAAVAIARKIPLVGYAAHAGDHTIYPDCRKEFVDSMNQTIAFGNWEGAEIDAPFILISKAEIVTIGAKIGVPFHLTWSCYKGVLHHCGKCGTCVERREAFQLAGVSDPTEYD